MKRKESGESETSESTPASTKRTPSTSVSNGKKKPRMKCQLRPVAPPSASNSSYKFSYWAKENHNSSIFGLQFNPHLQQDGHYVFATVGTNRINIYECCENNSFKLLQTYSDPDPDEMFYCCTWTVEDGTSNALLIVAGARGIIRVLRPSSNECIKHYKGHGQSINDLKIHPHNTNLLLSSSKDYSLRLWNLKTDVCAIIFGGVEGHRDEVLHADFHLRGHRIISCGMDHSLKIWTIDTEKIQNIIEESFEFGSKKLKQPFRTYKEHFPIFTTRDIHHNYVDCVRWFGNFVLSKSCENMIVCWKPGLIEDEADYDLPKLKNTGEQKITIVHQFDFKDSQIWFMRFSMDVEQKYLAVGNQVGKTYVWDLDCDDVAQASHSVLSHPKCVAAIRQTCLSNDGSILICICDDSTVWRWDRCEIDVKNGTVDS